MRRAGDDDRLQVRAPANDREHVHDPEHGQNMLSDLQASADTRQPTAKASEALNVSILICSHGDRAWEALSWSRAYPSTLDQGAWETLVIHREQGTLADSRNDAAALATGDWLCFLDSDDELAPDYIRAMNDSWPGIDQMRFPLLLAPAVEYCATETGLALASPSIPNKGRWPDLNECVIGTLVQKKLLTEVGGFRDLPSLEDYDLWLRCVKAGAVIRHVERAVYRAHVSVNGRNRDQTVYPDLRREHAEVWEKR
jgi:hypothetical protein